MSIFDAFTGASAKDAATKNAALYNQYGTDATNALNTGMANALPAANSAISAYTPLANLGQQYGAAPTMLLNSLGVNGQAGNDAAIAAFHASPGYQYNVDQNVDQVARKAASLGVAASGNTLTGIQDRANNLANQDYQNWQTQLGGFTNPTLSATSGAATGQATGYGNLANLYQADAGNRAGIFGNVASGQANSNNASAQSQMNASSNFWTGLANLGGNVAKGAFSGGGYGSSPDSGYSVIGYDSAGNPNYGRA